MQDFNLNIKLASAEEMAKYQKEQLELLKTSTMIQGYINDENQTWDDVEANISKYTCMVNALKTCAKCKGLQECKQSAHRGYFEKVIKDDDGIVDIYLSPCKYLNEENRRNTYLKSYVYTDFEDDMLDLDLENLIPSDADQSYLNAWDKLVKYSVNLDKEKKGIYLYGSMGVGKTWLMIGLCNYLVQIGKKVAFVNTSKLMIENKAKINTKLMDNLVNVDFLVLDDIGQESVNSLSRDELLYPLLESRVLRHKPTCFTSNFSMKDLKEHFAVSQYGDREEMKAGRLIERIKALSCEVELIGESRR